jgi:glutathione S-transferase
VTLYGRVGCTLCEEARHGLLAMRAAGATFRLAEVDIETEPELHRRMLERIPVIEVEGVEVCELFLDPDAIGSRLATLGG